MQAAGGGGVIWVSTLPRFLEKRKIEEEGNIPITNKNK
jgi:hypothetical protein